MGAGGGLFDEIATNIGYIIAILKEKGLFYAKPIFCLNFIHEWHTYGKSHNQNGNFYCECDKFVYQSTKGGCDC